MRYDNGEDPAACSLTNKILVDIYIKSIHSRAARVGAISCLAGVLAFFLGIPITGQQIPTPFPQPNSGRLGSHYPDSQIGFGDPDNAPDKKRLRILNVERQREIVSATARLLKLAEELNSELSVSDASATTPEQLRKIAEIGKLAKTVKEKMSFGVDGGLTVPEPLGGRNPH